MENSEEAYEKLFARLKEQQRQFQLTVLPFAQEMEKIRKLINGPDIKLYSNQLDIMAKLEPIRQSLQFAIKPNIAIPVFRDFGQPLRRLFSAIPSQTWTKLRLMSGLWIIHDTDLIEQLNGCNESDLENTIIDFYCSENWQRLARIVEKWSKVGSIHDRFPILNDCFDVVRLCGGTEINVANVVIPTLTAQLEGIYNEILETSNEDFESKLQVHFQVSSTQGNASSTKRKRSEKEDLLCDLISEQISTWYSYELRSMMLEIFKNSYDFEAEKELGDNRFNLNRHKLLHGDSIMLDYGSTANLIRLFLFLDLVIRLKVGLEEN